MTDLNRLLAGTALGLLVSAAPAFALSDRVSGTAQIRPAAEGAVILAQEESDTELPPPDEAEPPRERREPQAEEPPPAEAPADRGTGPSSGGTGRATAAGGAGRGCTAASCRRGTCAAG